MVIDLKGKKGLIVGVANEASIAYGCAKMMHAAGAELAITYLNAKAEPYVRPLAEAMKSPIILPCDVEVEGQLEAVFETIARQWKTLDFVVHSIAYAPKEDLHGRVVDCSRDGFLRAMDVSCHSFIKISKLAEPLLAKGGTLITMTFQGSQRVIPHYGLMGPVKAALEAVVKYVAVELGEQGIRVHAISPGPLETRAASGISNFNDMLYESRRRAALHQKISIDDVGNIATMLVSDEANSLTGNIIYVDGGYNIV